MSLVLDASAAVSLHFSDEAEMFREVEELLEAGTAVFTAPNFFQEVMEALRKAVRDSRTTAEDAAAWLTVLDSYNITPVPVHPCAGSATWLIAEQLNISPYDAGYLSVAKARGLPIFSRDGVIISRAPKIGISINPKLND